MKLIVSLTFLLFVHQICSAPIPSQPEAVGLIVFENGLNKAAFTDQSSFINRKVSTSVTDDGLNSWQLTFPKGIALTSGLKLLLKKPLVAGDISSINFNIIADSNTVDPSFTICLTNENGAEYCSGDFLATVQLSYPDFNYVSVQRSNFFKGEKIVSLQIHSLKNNVQQIIFLSNFYFHKVYPTPAEVQPKRKTPKTAMQIVTENIPNSEIP